MTCTCWSSVFFLAITSQKHTFRDRNLLSHLNSLTLLGSFIESCCSYVLLRLLLLHLCWGRLNLCMTGLMIWFIIKCMRVNVYMGCLSFSLSLCLSCILFIAPSFHPHIKAIHHQDQTQWVSQRQADLLLGFLWVCEFYDWGRGPGTQGYISDKVCLWLLVFLALFMPSLSAWPPWIARPHVNATFDLNSWVPEDVTASTGQLQQRLRNGCIYSHEGCNIVEESTLKVKFLWQIIGEQMIYKLSENRVYFF